MGQCISWDRTKSIWALRILSEVFLCTGIVACVAAFTIEQGKPNIYFLVSGFCLFLFAAIGLASSFCLSHDGKKASKHPVHTVTLPSAAGSVVAPDPSVISAILALKTESGLNPMFNSMKSIPVDSLHSEAPKNYKQKYGSKASDRLSSINEVRSITKSKNSDSASDEGFNSGNQSPEVNSEADRKKRRRARRPRSVDPSKSSSTESRRTDRKSQKSHEDPYLSRI
jgi:hypothetical protein